jgi:hypothetical protein
MKHHGKSVCPNCGVPVTNLGKHLERERCKEVFRRRRWDRDDKKK